MSQSGPKTLGELFTESPAYKAAVAQKRGGTISFAVDLPVNPGEIRAEALRLARATLTTTTAGLTSYGRPDGVITLGTQMPTIAELFFPGQTNNTTIRYMKEVSYTNSATALAEEGQYQEASFDLEEADMPVVKIGVITPVTEEIFEDSAQIQNYVNVRLPLMNAQLEDQHCLTGSGNSNQMLGVLNVSGIQSEDRGNSSLYLDAAHRALTKIRTVAQMEPDTFVMNPSDWEYHCMLVKDGTGKYYSNGPHPVQPENDGSGNAPTTGHRLWGKRVILTTAMTRGKALCGAFYQGGCFWRRKGIVVEASNSHSDDFQYGRLRLRATSRGCLTIWRAPAFCTIDNLEIP